MEDKPKFAFVGNSHMAFWALNVYFPQWECLNYGAPELNHYLAVGCIFMK